MSRFIPRGVAVAGLGKRVLAFVIDALPAAAIGGAVPLVWRLNDSPSAVLVSAIAGSVLTAAYGLYQWWAYGTQGAGLGARLTGLRLVGLSDGEPIGWWRYFIRQLVFSALMGTVVGGIALLVFLVIHERRQGWHDLAVGAVVVQPKVAERRERASVKKASATSTVGLPPHLSSAFSPQPGTTQEPTSAGSGWGSYTPPADPAPQRPSWLPQLESEPMAPTPQPQAPHGQAAQRPAVQQPAPQQWPSSQPSAPSQAWGAPAASGSVPASQPSAPWQSTQQPPAQQAPVPQAPPAPQTSAPSQPSQQAPAPQQWPSSQASAPSQQWGESAPTQPMPTTQSGPAPQFPASQSSAPGVAQPASPPRPVNQGWIPLPTPSSIIEPSSNPDAPRIRQRDFGEVEEEDGTRISKPVGGDGGRPGGEGWYVRLDDGREVELAVPVLLGRNPQKSAGDPDSHLVPASGDGRMISRTHVMIGTDPRGVFVVDRGSTNGTALVTQAGELEPCPTDTQVRVREGQQVSYGNRWFTVLRRPQRH